MNSGPSLFVSLPFAAVGGRHVPILHEWRQIFIANYVIQLIQYAVTAGLAFLIFYALLRGLFLNRKIQAAFPPFSDIRREIFYSLSSLAVFSMVGLFSICLQRLHYAQIYHRIDVHGWPYFFFSIAAMIVLHDTWFYWTHRLMHWRPLFKVAHRVHHLSHNPTPWAAFSFHPIEALIEAMIYPVIILVLPVHPLAALAWLLYMTTLNVGGHLGFELFPKGFAHHWLFCWHNTSVHHNMHHSHVHCNYGLYFNVWDRLMGTNHARYEDHFDEVVSSPKTYKATLPVLRGR